MFSPEILWPLGVLFFATLIRFTLGFGDSLLSMPLLVMLGLRFVEAAPIVTLLSVTNGLIILGTSHRQIALRDALQLVIGAAFGIPCGLICLKFVRDDILQFGLGMLVILFVIFSLRQPKARILPDDRLGSVFGFMSGFLGGSVNVHGPPLVVYGMLRNWNPERFRATLQGYFLPAGTLTMLGQVSAGLWTRNVWEIYLSAIPVIGLACLLGVFLRRRISSAGFTRLVRLLLVAIGVLLILQASGNLFDR